MLFSLGRGKQAKVITKIQVLKIDYKERSAPFVCLFLSGDSVSICYFHVYFLNSGSG